jgi:hypothetical protein
MRLKICGRSYTVRRGSIPGSLGLCESDKAVITIADDLEVHSNIPAETILLHEVCHAVLYETGLGHVMKGTVEEAVVHGLALGLSRVGYILNKPLPSDIINSGQG